MTFDLRTLTLRQGQEACLSDLIVVLDGRILNRVIAFDTDGPTVEVLAFGPSGVIHFELLDAPARLKHGNYRGLATVRIQGKDLTVYRKVHDQDELTAILPKD